MTERLKERRELPSSMPPIVIKLGGDTLFANQTIIDDIAKLHKEKRPLIVVHGGGTAIDKMLKAKRINSERINGVRVTGERALKVVIAALAEVNEILVKELESNGVNALGLTGKEIKLLRSVVEEPALGFVGKVKKVNKVFLEDKLSQNMVPVISPISYTVVDGTIQLLNSNADGVAGAIASAFAGSELLMLSDVKGVEGKEGRLIHELTPMKYSALIERGLISGGMIPKVAAAFEALRCGSVPRIVSGLTSHPIRRALEDKSIGTSFTAK